jgi:glycosyltransferase involved in cell wall biosynthesis
MSPQTVRVSLVVTTLGRTTQLERLFESLVVQDYKSFEVIVVDQNSDDRLGYLFERDRWPFALTRIHTPNARGLSRGRNVGWRSARGEWIVFPDDDCWYPSWFLSRASQLMSASDADILTGRAADENGHDINGRYSQEAHVIDRSNVWVSGIEWVMFFKRAALLSVGGFDEGVGIGASTPWQSCEGQDILLKALASGLSCRFDPSLYGHHERFEAMATELRRSKGRAYGRGLGYVLRKHHYGIFDILYWAGRPMLKLMVRGLVGDVNECIYLWNVACGRLEGYVGLVWGSRRLA